MNSLIEILPAQLPAVGGRAWLRPDGHCIALFNVDGRYLAVTDSCPHQGASLGSGKLIGATVQCPAHGLRFDLSSGCMVQAPAMKVTTYPIHIEEGRVYLRLPDQEQPR